MTTPAPTPASRMKVSLPTWVNVILVLILLASCGADRLTAGEVAERVAERIGPVDTGPGTAGLASADDVLDLCRLMGAVAAKQAVPVAVMDQEQLTRCHEVAQEAAAMMTAAPK